MGWELMASDVHAAATVDGDDLAGDPRAVLNDNGRGEERHVPAVRVRPGSDHRLLRDHHVAADGHVIPEQDRWDLVDYIKTLSPRFKSEPVPDAIPVPAPPYATVKETPAAMIKEGRMVYRVLQCWSCHGNGGKGDGPSSNQLVDDWETPIHPFDFTSGAFKSDSK